MDSQDKAVFDERLAAFEKIVSEYEAPLLRYATRIIRQHDAAQVVVQDTFIRLFKVWKDEFVPCPQLSNWLYCVAHNCAVDFMRRETRRYQTHLRHAEEQDDMVEPNRGAGFEISEEAERAAEALCTLSLREQQLVILKVYENKTYAEIAQIAGLTSGNVGYILHHPMKKLAAAMQKNKGEATS